MPYTFRAILDSLKVKDGETTLTLKIPKSDYDRVNPCGVLDGQVFIVQIFPEAEALAVEGGMHAEP